jgi:hypothetical protein
MHLSKVLSVLHLIFVHFHLPRREKNYGKILELKICMLQWLGKKYFDACNLL